MQFLSFHSPNVLISISKILLTFDSPVSVSTDLSKAETKIFNPVVLFLNQSRGTLMQLPSYSVLHALYCINYFVWFSGC